MRASCVAPISAIAARGLSKLGGCSVAAAITQGLIRFADHRICRGPCRSFRMLNRPGGRSVLSSATRADHCPEVLTKSPKSSPLGSPARANLRDSRVQGADTGVQTRYRRPPGPVSGHEPASLLTMELAGHAGQERRKARGPTLERPIPGAPGAARRRVGAALRAALLPVATGWKLRR